MLDFKLYICYAKFVTVSHNKSQFTKKIRKTNGVRLAGTQQIDRVWFHVKKSIPKTLNNRKAGYLNETDIMKCVWVFVWRRNCHNDMYKCLGDLCRKSWNKDVGNAEEKAYSCLFQHDGFRPTKTIEITPWLSFFHTLPWLLTHPQNIDICEKPLSLWRNLGTSFNRNISMCWNTRPLRGALTPFFQSQLVFRVSTGSVLQGNVPGRKWVTVGIDSPWSVILGLNR